MSSNEVKVGALTLGGAAILAGIISFMGAFQLGSGGYELKIAYPQVSGLMPGHMVRYAGVQVGKVKNIAILPDKVEVIAEIEDKIQIPAGAGFTIGSDGIMGEKFVSIIPPKESSGAYLPKGSQVQGREGGGMEEFFSSSGDVVSKLDAVAGSLNDILGDKEVQQSLKESLAAMGQISKNMSAFTKVMADVAVANQEEISKMLGQLQTMTGHMNAITAHLESIAAEADNNGATGRNVAAIAEHLARTSGRVENVARLLENIAQDPETATSLRDTIKNAKEASARANQVLGTLTEAKINIDAGRSARGNDWRGNLGLTLSPTANSYIYLGGYDLGAGNKLDAYVGQRYGGLDLSAGAMQGEMGVGLGYGFGSAFRVYSQFYDFDEAKLKVGGELWLTDSVALYGESMDVRKGSKRETYVGLRSRF